MPMLVVVVMCHSDALNNAYTRMPLCAEHNSENLLLTCLMVQQCKKTYVDTSALASYKGAYIA